MTGTPGLSFNPLMTSTPIQIDLETIFRNRGGALARIPGPVVRMLGKLICQEQLNGILSEAWPRRGSEFAASAMKTLGVTASISGEENIPDSGRFIFASNHPLGGLDGIAIIRYLGQRYGDSNFRFLVNDMLMNVEPLADIFLPINKFGSQGRSASRLINEAYASDKQIAIFPAGLVSRLGKEGIRDLQWQKAFVAKAMEFERDIIPVHFHGQNAPYFYKAALWRKRLGIKVNLEQALLPRQVCASKGKDFRISFGKPISWSDLKASGEKPLELARRIKEEVYAII